MISKSSPMHMTHGVSPSRNMKLTALRACGKAKTMRIGGGGRAPRAGGFNFVTQLEVSEGVPLLVKV
jgi:hypothetical protein